MRVQSSSRGSFVAVPIKDKTGREHLVVILTYTFAVDPFGRVELISPGPAPALVDEYNGADAAISSIRKPSLLFDHKPGTDVILIGHAHPPLRGNATHVDVSLRVGPVAKTVRAHGLRVWKAAAFGGISPGPARPLREPVPLVYELAWGGSDYSDPERPLGEPRNTVGRGVARDPRSLIEQPAAQLEDPAHPIQGGQNVPSCFGAIHRHWQPRASYAGTYDQAWMDTKMPLLPDDFDPRFHVAVPHDQWSPRPLRGDEPFEVLGATPEGTWRFALPRIAPGFSSLCRGLRGEHRTHLDTILIDADAGRVELTWRAAIPLPRKHEMLESAVVIEKRVI
ncbi:DUF2169 domain-containing protein [Sorangium sp. So ce118]